MKISRAEAYAESTGRLLPELCELLQPFFPPSFNVAKKVKVVVTDEVESMTGSRVWVMLGTMRVHRGALDYPNLPEHVSTLPDGSKVFRMNGAYDLHTVGGFAVLGHEVYHVYQYYRSGWLSMALSAFQGLLKGLLGGKLKYSHDDAPMEQEAIAFEKTLQRAQVKFTGEQYVS